MSKLELAILELKRKKKEQGKRNREAGYRFENVVAKHLKRNSDFTITSSGSRGAFDIFSRRTDGTIWYVSCKTNGYWTQSEWNDLSTLNDKIKKSGKECIKLAYYTTKKNWTLRNFK